MVDAERLWEFGEGLGREMGPDGLEVDEWLAGRGIVGFAEFLQRAIPMVRAGVVEAGVPAAMDRAMLMHGFFVGVVAGIEVGMGMPRREAQS